jgi:hypothetical protein
MSPPVPQKAGESPPEPTPDDEPGSGIADCFRAIEQEPDGPSQPDK